MLTQNWPGVDLRSLKVESNSWLKFLTFYLTWESWLGRHWDWLIDQVTWHLFFKVISLKLGIDSCPLCLVFYDVAFQTYFLWLLTWVIEYIFLKIILASWSFLNIHLNKSLYSSKSFLRSTWTKWIVHMNVLFGITSYF